ncbi:hypothetical protein L6452_10735 [Arctium lappa]|uniref:Uncharacterized protein n=1 Tax=Arctium lappa TaxID=4217 RepID=A0ACB9DN30_ARCLA|nr:hypothetical protein L6452_10735 [Arctium lappa]
MRRSKQISACFLMADTIFSQVPAVVAGAVRALFDRISELDMECWTRLILWFSHHLSLFMYRDKVKQTIENTPALEELLLPKSVPDFRYGSQDDGKTEYTLST